MNLLVTLCEQYIILFSRTTLQMFLAILCGWMLSWVLTVSGALSDDPTERTYRARTDINNAVFKDNGWFRLPYPGNWVICLLLRASFLENISYSFFSVKVCFV